MTNAEDKSARSGIQVLDRAALLLSKLEASSEPLSVPQNLLNLPSGTKTPE